MTPELCFMDEHASFLHNGKDYGAGKGPPVVFLAIPWLVEATPRSLLPYSSAVLSMCACFQMYPVDEDTSHIGLGPTLMMSS